MKRKRQKNPDRIGVGKFWAWGSREVSETSNVLIQTFFLFYCTETMLLNPAVVGVLLGTFFAWSGVLVLLAILTYYGIGLSNVSHMFRGSTQSSNLARCCETCACLDEAGFCSRSV